MQDHYDDSDSANTFWPGYVDATTNLALNLLFLLTIMVSAVFMFALEMGRASVNAPKQPQKQEAQVVSKATTDPVKEIAALKLEIQRLNKMLAQKDAPKVHAGGLKKTARATSSVPKPVQGLDKAHASDFEITVVFKAEAIELKREEREQLLETLKPVVERGQTTIYVEVPAGFSEAKRMGFYRAMAVRNLLLEMKMPKEKIAVSVVEGKSNANASLVLVR